MQKTRLGISVGLLGAAIYCIVTVTEKEVGPPETGAVSMVLTGAMLVVAGIAVNMGKRRKKH